MSVEAFAVLGVLRNVGWQLSTFCDSLSVPSSRIVDFLTLEDGTNRLSKNISNQLPAYAA
jgi:hypothetical protein